MNASRRELMNDLATVFVGIAIANFGWAALTDKNWIEAFSRTYFQANALVAVAFVHKK